MHLPALFDPSGVPAALSSGITVELEIGSSPRGASALSDKEWNV